MAKELLNLPVRLCIRTQPLFFSVSYSPSFDLAVLKANIRRATGFTSTFNVYALKSSVASESVSVKYRFRMSN